MSRKSDSARLRFVLAKLEDLLAYQARYPSLADLFRDSMAYDAVLMCLLQIGETLQKVQDESWLKQLPVQGAYVVRNIIAHAYEGVDCAIIERIVENEIPRLREVVLGILAGTPD